MLRDAPVVSASAGTFTGRLNLAPGKAAAKGDGALQFQPGTTVQVSHGFGYLGRHATLKP